MRDHRTGGFKTCPDCRSIRLKGYDYSQPGAYCVTIVTHDRECPFGDVADGEMRPSGLGESVRQCWFDIPTHCVQVTLDACMVMPNHVHGIIMIAGTHTVGAGLVPAHDRATVGAGPVPAPNGATKDGATTRVAPTIGAIVGAFKSITTVVYGRGVIQSGWPPFRGRLWQRNDWEHIIRDGDELNRIRKYIANNPLQWELDRENPNVVGAGPEPSPSMGTEPWHV